MYIILILDKNLKSVLMIIKCPNNGTLTLSENWARDVIFQSLRLSFYSLVFSPLFISFSLFVAVWYRSEIKRNNVKSEFIERFTYLRIHNAVLFIVRLFRYSRKDIKRIKISLSDTSMQFRYAVDRRYIYLWNNKLRSRNVCWIRLYIDRLYLYAWVWIWSAYQTAGRDIAP